MNSYCKFKYLVHKKLIVARDNKLISQMSRMRNHANNKYDKLSLLLSETCGLSEYLVKVNYIKLISLFLIRVMFFFNQFIFNFK